MSDSKVLTGVPLTQGVNEDPLLAYTKIFIRFLQLVFGSFDRGQYHWDEGLETTEIVISDQGVLRSSVVEKRPMIVCMRGPTSWSNLSMDQFLSYNPKTGGKTHSDLVSSTMQYLCMAREGLEAQRIAWISGYATRVLKKTLLHAGMHRVGENVDYGAETDAGSLLPDSGKEFSLVPVSVPFFFQDTYTISPVDKLLLKGVDLRLTSESTRPAANALQSPAIGGKTLKFDKVTSLTQRVTVRASGSKK